ncbi:helix-turn-helix domain-containing protein [Streptococcus minor]|uniref:helix-turn-helix domain-containing protein n=1 Tax=Streptococcus minor TaxID=229549 RepID=UPI0003725E11|nr:helix-turn-helix transcriptional regulator [Streptococcus minor]
MFSTFEKIKELAKKQGISLNTLEEKMGYPRNTLYRYKTQIPSSERVAEIADYFNVSTDYLLGRTNNPSIAKEDNYIYDGKEVDVNDLAETAMVFDGKPLSDEDKAAIAEIIKIYLVGRQ